MGLINFDGINGAQKTQQVTPKNSNSRVEESFVPIGKNTNMLKEKVKMNSDGTYTKQIYRNGILDKETFGKVDKNGKEQITSVTLHFYEVDDSGKEIHTSKELIDEDGDGYNDVILTKKYENGRLVEEEKYFEEDIEKDIKNKPWNKHNRLMIAHDSGAYVF